MKKGWIVAISILVLLILLGWWFLRYIQFGVINPFGSDSCGQPFEDGFKKAVKANDFNFCSTFDSNSLNAYKNIEGYYYCSPTKIGNMKIVESLPRGGSFKDYCLIDMGLTTQNTTVCDMVSPIEKTLCLGLLTRNK